MRVLILTKKRILTVLCSLIAGVLAVLIGIQGVAAITASMTKRLIPIYCVKTEEKQIAISFDAAWEDEILQKKMNSGKYVTIVIIIACFVAYIGIV